VAPADLERREKDLLQLARQWMPRLPFKEADLLIIEEIGKNISGTGMDTNVVGRKRRETGAGEDEWPKIKRIHVRGLTKATHGNGCGIGIAEFCLTRVVDQLDMKITRINSLTGGHPTGARIPIYYHTDREVLDAALSTVGLVEPPDARVMWIANTLQVAEVECSRAYLDEARQRNDLEIIVEPRPLPLDSQGNLTSMRSLSPLVAWRH
jgi:hypothetical protein